MKRTTISTANLGLSFLLLIVAPACKDDEARRDTSSTAAKPIEGSRDPDIATLTVTLIDVDTKLAIMCGMAESSVFFKYDSTQLSADAKDRLDRLAKCATEGAAKGEELAIIGRTDPVGSDAYNKQLGMSRADAVAQYLRGQGVAAARVEAISKGEDAANPAVPAGWGFDRRVTVRLRER